MTDGQVILLAVKTNALGISIYITMAWVHSCLTFLANAFINHKASVPAYLHVLVAVVWCIFFVVAQI